MQKITILLLTILLTNAQIIPNTTLEQRKMLNWQKKNMDLLFVINDLWVQYIKDEKNREKIIKQINNTLDEIKKEHLSDEEREKLTEKTQQIFRDVMTMASGG